MPLAHPFQSEVTAGVGFAEDDIIASRSTGGSQNARVAWVHLKETMIDGFGFRKHHVRHGSRWSDDGER